MRDSITTLSAEHTLLLNVTQDRERWTGKFETIMLALKEATAKDRELQKMKRNLDKYVEGLRSSCDFSMGKLLFCDLAGSEVSRGSVKINGKFFANEQLGKQTKEHLDEA